MRTGRLWARHVGGASLAAAAVFGTTALGLGTTAASAATAVATTVTLHPVKTPVAVGSETQTFSGTVTGQTNDGYPTGTVTVKTSKGTTLCTATLTNGTGDTATFSCALTASELAAGQYTIHAHYTGGASSKPTTFTYDANTSSARSLRVTTPETSTVTLSTITSTVVYGFETQTFTGTVTGHTGKGYPSSGAVTIVTDTTGTVLCSGSLTTGSGFKANFTCNQTTGHKLAVKGTAYHVKAHYAGGTSSTPLYSYLPVTSSNTQSLTVVTPTKVTPTVTLNALTSPVVHGAEAQVVSGTVKGVSGDGYPKGTVTVKTATNKVLCTAALTQSSSTTAHFSCSATTPSLLAQGSYTVHAHYTGGASSVVPYAYNPKTSSAQTLVVSGGVATTTVLGLSAASEPLGYETLETFTVTVTGKSGDGYPKGKVTVTTTASVTVCSTTTRSAGSNTYTSTFTCSPHASTLSAGTYRLAATYVPTSTHSSSTTSIAYAGSTSPRMTFTVSVTGKSGDGYPKGTVAVKTSTSTSLCTTTTPTSHTTYASTFACSPRAAALSTGTYSVVATYAPSSPSSSTTSVTYAASTSSAATLVVVTTTTTRIYGSTPDATAAQELESVYPGTKGTCPGTTTNRPVVLATDAHFPDALAASYLSKWLGTGMLLTPTSSLTGATLTAIRVEGITRVDVVGGPLAVSTTVVAQLRNTYVYKCGGTTQTSSHLTVTRLYGATQYTTAADIANAPGSGFVGSVDVHGAYGLYNDTSGKSSAAPPAGVLRTAILASGAEFQDAEAAATLAYAEDFPLLLTTPTALSPQALSSLTSLGVKQVVLMGGPLAVSNAVVTSLKANGISVLRVAGIDGTDTAVQLADFELASTTGRAGLGWSPTGGVTIAQGGFYSDGLAGAVVSAHGGATAAGPQPLLLTESPTLAGTYLTTFLKAAGTSGIGKDGAPVFSLTILGGPLAVTTAVVSSLEADL